MRTNGIYNSDIAQLSMCHTDLLDLLTSPGCVVAGAGRCCGARERAGSQTILLASEDVLDRGATLSRPDLDIEIEARDHAEQRAELYSDAAVFDG